MLCSVVKPIKSHSESANVYRRDVSTRTLSKLQYSGTVLVDQRLVVRLQLLNVGHLGGLGVQVKFAVEGRRVEGRLEVAIERQAVYLRERERERDANLNSWTHGSICRSLSLHKFMQLLCECHGQNEWKRIMYIPCRERSSELMPSIELLFFFLVSLFLNCVFPIYKLLISSPHLGWSSC